MIEQYIIPIVGGIGVFFSFLGCLALLIVAFIVNPVLDPLFLNDRYFNPLIREGHPFFFGYRAMLYAGAVISKRLAKRTMKLEDDEFRSRVVGLGYVSCWVLMISMFVSVGALLIVAPLLIIYR